MKRTFRLNPLSQSSINDCIKWIRDYQKDLKVKTELLVRRLTDIGVTTAYQSIYGDHTNKMENYVFFTTSVNPAEYECTGIMIGIGQSYPSHWYDSDGNEHNDIVKPLLMLEFGSAFYALPPQERFGDEGGKGTFSVRGNSDKPYWFFATDIDENGRPTNWQLGTAIKPTRPMYKAWSEMYTRIYSIAKEVFGNV